MKRIRDRAAVEARRADVRRLMARVAVPVPRVDAVQPQPQEPRAMKAKVHTVQLETGARYLVMARTKAGALRGLREYVLGSAHVDLATGEEIFDAGVAGDEIIDREKYRSTVDPNQMPLDGVSESVDEGDRDPDAPF